MATGNMVISEKISDNEYFEPGKDYVEIRTTTDLKKSVEYYLNHEQEREEIARNGQNKIFQYFDSKKQFQKLFDDLLTNKYRKYNHKMTYYFEKKLYSPKGLKEKVSYKLFPPHSNRRKLAKTVKSKIIGES
jgi:hypothetical protein